MNELRLAVRRLRSSPVITIVAVLSLALGIGANTAIFSLVNGLILRPLPVVEPARLAIVSDARAGRSGSAAWTFGMWDQIRKYAGEFDSACAWFTERLNLSERGGRSDPADALWVSGTYFGTLGVPALVGRTITPQDDTRGAGARAPVAMISYRLWQRRFGGSADVVGKRIVVERLPFTVVGVTPPSFFGAEVGRGFDVALPMAAEPLIPGRQSRIDPQGGYYALTVLVRLKPWQTTDQGTAFLRSVQPQIREAAMPLQLPAAFQREFMKDPFLVVPAGTGTSLLRLQYQRPLLVIMVVVALVLVIACANIANLQLARAIVGRTDSSIRLSLGASRWRLIRQSLVETLLLCVAGAVLALFVASWSSQALVSWLTAAREQVYLDLSIDRRVLLFTGLVAIVATVLSGLLPALRASRSIPIDTLKVSRSTTDVRTGRTSGSLIVAQVALSVVIVVAAGLFLQSLGRLASLPPGFDADRVLLVNVSLARVSVAPADRIPFVQRLVSQVTAVPAVARAGASLVTPIQGLGMIDLVRVPGGTTSMMPMQGNRLGERSTFANAITPGWFATYGTPLKAGRDFTERDGKSAPSVIIVNEAFVRKFLRAGNPIGTPVAFDVGGAAPLVKTVVGVVADAAYDSLRAADVPIEYTPLAQLPFPGPPPTDITLSVRATAGSPMLLARSITAALMAVDRDLVFSFRPMSDRLNASLIQDQLIATLSGLFGALALLLAGLGLYGMTAYAVASRRVEIGIRMALGSTGSRIVRLLLSHTARLVIAGIAIGIIGSLWASKFVAVLLFGVEPRDPLALVGAAVVLCVVGLAATTLPALRASQLDPASVLRES